MGKDNRTKERNSSGLDPEDADLWQQVAKTTEPLRKGKNRAVKTPDHPESQSIPAVRSQEEHSEKPVKRHIAKEPARRAPPSLATIEKREIRGLGGGRVSVDARIDLHGARQLEAHRMLKSFLAGAQENGHRYVLVITGKGSSRAQGGEAQGRGVLNREVPRWLSEPEFRQWVVSFAPAHKRHGGEGALYVRIRRRKAA
ncbi:MAG: Smr/MutS family protein [Hyphomicrobiaceae bacterium]|nr:Smr/MutS family protein [Hyphomicrobiaceae bacterium]